MSDNENQSVQGLRESDLVNVILDSWMMEQPRRTSLVPPAFWAEVAARAILSQLSSARVPEGYVVSDVTRTKYRTWSELGPDWTTDIQTALHFVRRDDAEKFAADDEDGWHILLVSAAPSHPQANE